MAFLRNAWYAAGWDRDIAPGTATRIQILSEWIAIYRGDDGVIRAIGDRCPHRFAPLSEGKVVGGLLECPYHGLRFDETGRCVHNPHGDGMIPKGAGVRQYPAVARHSAIWIWMGAADRVDALKIPDYPFLTDPKFTACHGYTRIDANYELMTDNLLDLTHAAYLHPALLTSDSTGRTRISVEQNENRVTYLMWVDDEPITALFQPLWDSEEETALLRTHMHWTAPANIMQDVGMTPKGESETDSPAIPTVHLITPATETSTHYFWASARNRRLEDAELTQKLHDLIDFAFDKEDGPMIKKAFENMNGEDFWALRPVILVGDTAGVRARRLLQKLIRAEANSAEAGVIDVDRLASASAGAA